MSYFFFSFAIFNNFCSEEQGMSSLSLPIVNFASWVKTNSSPKQLISSCTKLNEKDPDNILLLPFWVVFLISPPKSEFFPFSFMAHHIHDVVMYTMTMCFLNFVIFLNYMIFQFARFCYLIIFIWGLTSASEGNMG